ncbi:hypothetical protein SYNTR_2139 [Candidatus Syntrophocurvum alkaliphilum]|uniref:Uncharacterized protein n=1 Tax=Candidatus Syntrophocurvum alkaliphilum TaxID=2293317 RepID=A0A6I6DI37_9FIRM|nr:hypothetical protein [Candidatus Syntrophocurvum alkaliphilum]QGU00733.1 hypothetical protein SYNTR_2139 [Candidatus Syntrophocurvum alkaliphilum]
MENILKIFVVLTLIFLLIKGLIYLLIFLTTHKIQEHSFENKRKARIARNKRLLNNDEKNK